MCTTTIPALKQKSICFFQTINWLLTDNFVNLNCLQLRLTMKWDSRYSTQKFVTLTFNKLLSVLIKRGRWKWGNFLICHLRRFPSYSLLNLFRYQMLLFPLPHLTMEGGDKWRKGAEEACLKENVNFIYFPFFSAKRFSKQLDWLA